MPNNEAIQAKLAAERKQAKEHIALQSRIASAWVLAGTYLPNGSEEARYKLAENLLANSTPTLKSMTRQATVNTYYAAVAQDFQAKQGMDLAKLAKVAEDMHKDELNEFLEGKNVLEAEKNSVAAELKGEAKNASEENELPAKYPDPKRKEPEGMEGSHAADRDPETVNKTNPNGEKNATKKKACEGKECDHKDCDKKKASKKVAEGEEAPQTEAPAADAGTEDAAPVDGDAPEGDDAPAEGDDNNEAFDPEKEKLKDAISDTETAIDKLEDAIGDVKDDEFDLSNLGENTDEEPEAEGLDIEMNDPDAYEFDVTEAFNPGNIEDKVSSLSHEDIGTAAFGDDVEFAPEAEAEEGFFGPTPTDELEATMDGEEEMFHPGDLFMQGEEDDPLAVLLAGKQAADGVVEPGDLVGEFNDVPGHDDRDADTDHSDDIFGAVLESLKQGEFPGKRTKQDQQPELRDPKNAGVRKLNPIMASGKPSRRSEADEIADALFRRF